MSFYLRSFSEFIVCPLILAAHFISLSFPFFLSLHFISLVSFSLLQAAMPSPVVELRGPNIKHHEASFLEDYSFQQAMPYIHALRDPVCNRVTLVSLFLSVLNNQLQHFDL